MKFDLLLLKRAQGLGVQRYEGCYGNYFSDPTNQQNMNIPYNLNPKRSWQPGVQSLLHPSVMNVNQIPRLRSNKSPCCTPLLVSYADTRWVAGHVPQTYSLKQNPGLKALKLAHVLELRRLESSNVEPMCT